MYRCPLMRSLNGCNQLTVTRIRKKPTERCAGLPKKLKISQPLKKYQEVHYSVHTSAPLNPIITHINKKNQTHTFNSFCKIHFNSILPSTLRSPKSPLSLRFPITALYQLAFSRMRERLHVHLVLQRRTQMTIFLIVRFSPYLCHFLALRSTHTRQDSVLKYVAYHVLS